MLIGVVNTVFMVLDLLILLRVLWSWVDPNPYPSNAMKRTLYQLTDPLLEPIRQVIPPIGGTIDVSPIIALLLLQALQQLALRFAGG